MRGSLVIVDRSDFASYNMSCQIIIVVVAKGKYLGILSPCLFIFKPAIETRERLFSIFVVLFLQFVD